MPSLVEMTGALSRALFVPGNVIAAQDANQAMLQERADKLNSNVPETIALATRNGTMTDGQARKTMQDMNSSVFLSGNANRELGEQVITDVKEAAAKAPSVLAESIHGGLNSIGKTIWKALPWWVWTLVGLYVAVQLAMILNALRPRSS